jgi:hypothetical protein
MIAPTTELARRDGAKAAAMGAAKAARITALLMIFMVLLNGPMRGKWGVD